MNVKIFERFRGACDRFFTEKAAFFKRLKEEQAQKLGQENGTLRKGRGTERQYGLESHGRQTHADTKGMENHRCRS